jgi:hypothetical protein
LEKQFKQVIGVWSFVLLGLLGGSPARAEGGLIFPSDPALERLAESTGIRQFTVQTLQPVGDNDTLTIPLQVNGLSCTAVLYPHSVRSPSFGVRVMDRNGVALDFPGPPITSYRGKLEGQLDGRIIASVRDGKIDATIQTSDTLDGQWVIRPITGVEGFSAADHLVYRSIDAPSVPASCGIQSTAEPSDEILPPPATAPLDVLVCELACDADVEYYTLNGSSVEATVADIENIINAMSDIYERDTKIAFEITQIVVRTAEPDTYETTNPYAFLNEVRSYWGANHRDIPRDIVQLFTGKDLNGTTIGIGDENGLCWGYSIVQSRYTTDMARRIMISAHEIGHMFYNSHCDDQDWCRIMCSSVDQCAGGFASFGPYEISQIRNFAASRSCLSNGIVNIPTTTLPFFDDFSYVPSSYGQSRPLDATHGWTAADRAKAICWNTGGNPPKSMRLTVEKYSNLNFGFTRYGTVRTMPMVLGGPAKVMYKVCQYDVEAGQMLKVEYLNSSLWLWQPLDSITSTGGTNPSTTFVQREFTLPLDAMGRYFAVRFSALGTTEATKTTSWWYVDDVSITELQNLADINGDKRVDLQDWAICAAAWLSNEGDPAWNPACNLKQPPDTIINLDDFKVWVENWLRTL